MSARLIALLLVAAGLAMRSVPAPAGELSIAVAANFTDAMRELVPLFEQASGHRVKASFGSTGKLFSQIENGAPFEVFLAADATRPARAEEEGLAVTGSRFTYARGRLALWSARDGVFQDGEAYMKRMAFSRIAIANPSTAPYGLAARQVMEHLGIWQTLNPRLVRGESIAQTFQFAASGNVDAAFVALAQARAWENPDVSVWVVPDAYYEPIAQQAVLLKRGAGSPAAREFLAFLKTAEVRRLISGHGYAVE